MGEKDLLWRLSDWRRGKERGTRNKSKWDSRHFGVKTFEERNDIMNLGREHWTRLASGLKRAAPSQIDVSSEEILEIKLSITTLLHFFHITGVGTRYSVINISSSESLSLEESTPKDQSDLSAMLASQLGEREGSGCLWDTFFQRLDT